VENGKPQVSFKMDEKWRKIKLPCPVIILTHYFPIALRPHIFIKKLGINNITIKRTFI
jgi:hypothetical protein